MSEINVGAQIWVLNVFCVLCRPSVCLLRVSVLVDDSSFANTASRCFVPMPLWLMSDTRLRLPTASLCSHVLVLDADARLPATYLFVFSMSWTTGNSTWVQDVPSCTTAHRARVSSVRVPSAWATTVNNWHWLLIFSIFCGFSSPPCRRLPIPHSPQWEPGLWYSCFFRTFVADAPVVSAISSDRFSGAEFSTNSAEQGLAAPGSSGRRVLARSQKDRLDVFVVVRW